MKVLTNDVESFRAMLSAAQKVRSIAAEGDYLDLLPSQRSGVRGLAPLTGTEQAIQTLADLASGERTIDDSSFRNLCRAFEMEGLGIVLAAMGWELP
jgi:hypothetical protein